MKLFRAMIFENKKRLIIESEYKTKKQFIDDLRRNGYKVNHKAVVVLEKK